MYQTEYSSPLHAQFSSALQHIPLQDSSDSKTCSRDLSTRLDSGPGLRVPPQTPDLESSCLCATSTLGHLKIPVSKIQLIICPESCFSHQIPHLHSPRCLGKKSEWLFTSIIKIHQEPALISRLPPLLELSTARTVLLCLLTGFPPSTFIMPCPTQSARPEQHLKYFENHGSESLLSSNVHDSQEPPTEDPAAWTAQVCILSHCFLRTREGTQVSRMVLTGVCLQGFEYVCPSACNTLPHFIIPCQNWGPYVYNCPAVLEIGACTAIARAGDTSFLSRVKVESLENRHSPGPGPSAWPWEGVGGAVPGLRGR